MDEDNKVELVDPNDPQAQRLTPTVNPWEAETAQQQRQVGKLKLSADFGLQEDPERSTRIIKAADTLKMPIDFVERNLDDIEREMQKKGFDPEQYRSRNPKVADWLSENPHHFSAAREDLGFFQTIGEFVNTNLAAAVSRSGNLMGGLMRATPFLADKAKSLSPISGFMGVAESALDDGSQKESLMDDMIDGLNLREEYNLLMKSYDSVMREYEGMDTEQATTWDDFKDQPLRNAIPFIVSTGIVSLPDMVAALTVLPVYVAARTGEVAQERAEMNLKKDATVEDFVVALPSAVVMSFFERIGARSIFGLDDAVKVYGDIPRAVGVAALKEGITEFGQEQIEYAATNIGTIQGWEIAESLERGLAGFVGGSGAGGLIRAGTGTYQAMRNSRQAQQQRKLMQALAGDSKMRDNLPQQFRQLVDRMTKDGPLENMFIPKNAHDEYWQSQNMDPREAAEQMFGDAKYYDEAGATGIIEVPTADYATRGAVSDAHQFYTENSTFDPEQETFAEAQETRRMAEEYDATVDRVDDAETDFDSVRNQVLGQLVLVQQRDVAEKNATYFASFLTTMGKRYGITATELYSRYNIKFSRDIPEAQQRRDDFLLSAVKAARSGAIPTEDEVYGRSIMSILREMGVRDPGGELANRDIDVGVVGGNRIVRPSAQWDLDDAANWAYQRGLIPEYDQTMFLELLDREMQGERFEIPEEYNAELRGVRDLALALMEQMDALGIDIDQLTDEEIARALSGNMPIEGDVLEQAQANGYEGSDVTEAAEWMASVNAGLDMSFEARMERARAMGFDVDRIFYHGSIYQFSAFRDDRPNFVTPEPELANEFSQAQFRATGGNVIKALIRTEKTFDFRDDQMTDELARHLMKNEIDVYMDGVSSNGPD